MSSPEARGHVATRSEAVTTKPEKRKVKRTFWQEVSHEIRPTVRHTVAVLVLLTCVLIVGLFVRLLKWVLDDGVAQICDVLEFIESLAAICAASMFGLTMFLAVSQMVWDLLNETWPGKLVRWCRRPRDPAKPILDLERGKPR